MTPTPPETACTTRSFVGWSSSRLGPIWPEEPASASVWQTVQAGAVCSVNTSRPASSSAASGSPSVVSVAVAASAASSVSAPAPAKAVGAAVSKTASMGTQIASGRSRSGFIGGLMMKRGRLRRWGGTAARSRSGDGHIDRENAPAAVVVATVVGLGHLFLHPPLGVRCPAGDGVGARFEVGRQHERTPGDATEVGANEFRRFPGLAAVRRDLDALEGIDAAKGNAVDLHLATVGIRQRMRHPGFDLHLPHAGLVGSAIDADR